MQSILFSGLDNMAESEILTTVRTKTWKRGELIASEGDISKGIIMVTDGIAAVQKYTPAGDYTTIRLLFPGDCFGEEVLFEKEARYSSALESISDVVTVSISRENMIFLMERYPKIRDSFMEVLFERLRRQDQRITLLSQKSVRQKIVYYLLLLSNQQGKEQVILPGSKEVTAKLLAIPRPSFSRELTQMEKEGRIKIRGRAIELTDIALLRKEIGDV